MHKRFGVLVGAWIGVAIAAAMAQSPPVHHIRGTIQAVGANSLTIATREGKVVTVTLKQPLRLVSMRRLDLSAVRSGSFIGTAARPGANGELVALEVVVFPDSARGTGEGHYGWDLTSDSTMTNANISALVQGSAGRELTLSYKGGSTKVLVPPDVPIVGPVPAQRADLKPGAPVFLTPTRAADGSLSTGAVVVGTNGVPPPM